MKKESKILDGTPKKRVFWSIISDYSINTSVCELIDNALDMWLKNRRTTDLSVELDLDTHNRTITIVDDAGGVPESELQVLISPGATLNKPDKTVIGMFEVGSKRAVVALAQNVKIRTRCGAGKSYRIDLDESWLEDENWDMPVYEVDDIPPGTTIVDLTSLRYTLDDEALENLRMHLQETYSQFLVKDNFKISLNSEPITPLRLIQRITTA